MFPSFISAKFATLPVSASISLVAATGVGIGAAVWRWISGSELPVAMRITIGLLRGVGRVLHPMLVRWPSSKDVKISHWDVELPMDDPDEDNDFKGTKRTLSQRVAIVVPNSTAQQVDYSRIYVNWHGGGFCGGNAHDDIGFCAQVVKQLNCVAILCSYRFAPENPYPAGFNDCVAMLRWIKTRYPHSTIAVGGFSAGGTLALNVSYKLRNDIAAVVAFYPPMNFSAESDNDFTEKDPYTRNVFHHAYLRHRPSESDLKSPNLSPSYATSETLPPHVALLAAEIDPNVRDMIKFIGDMERARSCSDRMEQHTGSADSISNSSEKSFTGKVFMGVLHGWTYLPDWLLGKNGAAAKAEAFSLAIATIAKGFATR